MTKQFMNEDFLLSTDTARGLYHDVAEKLPIIDYHCHVSPAEIESDFRASNISELWLGGDHYKWRCMRSCGVDERFITGDASDYEKFREFARIMPRLAGNPMYHWSHLELSRYFDYDGVLCESSCDEVWRQSSDALASKPELSVRGIISSSRVKLLCTTDDPCDSLEHHATLAHDSGFKTRVLPAFRPDRIINCERRGYRSYISRLAECSKTRITDLDSLKEACVKRVEHFAAHGCRTADHGIDTCVTYAKAPNKRTLDDIFRRAAASDSPDISDEEQAIFKTEMHRFFASLYRGHGWVMQFHFGVLRNVNDGMLARLGPDTGFDVIGTDTGIPALARLLSAIDSDAGLPRTILYSVNPADNAAVGALIGAFQRDSGEGVPLMAQGSAWWFNDNEQGMRDQLTSLANLGALGCFPGMLTDSRSFLSYTRHEYFRRILCDLIGKWVETGRLPDDLPAQKELIENICYHNADRLFGFNTEKED